LLVIFCFCYGLLGNAKYADEIDAPQDGNGLIPALLVTTHSQMADCD
jgi:hypothetical protein